jgi:hypothetical protein
MSAYKDALRIAFDETGPRALLAAELLSTGRGIVVLDSVPALRAEADRILCEVIATPSNPANYQAAVAAARSRFSSSSLSNSIAGKPLCWRVVDDYGTGIGVLWHGS